MFGSMKPLGESFRTQPQVFVEKTLLHALECFYNALINKLSSIKNKTRPLVTCLSALTVEVGKKSSPQEFFTAAFRNDGRKKLRAHKCYHKIRTEEWSLFFGPFHF